MQIYYFKYSQNIKCLLGQSPSTIQLHSHMHQHWVRWFSRNQKWITNRGTNLPRHLSPAVCDETSQLGPIWEIVDGHRPDDSGSHLPCHPSPELRCHQVLPSSAHLQDHLLDQRNRRTERADAHSGFIGEEGQQCFGACTLFIIHLRSCGALFVQWYCFCYLDLEYSKCRHPENKARTANWTVYSEEIFLCGQRTCPVVNGTQYECLNPIFYGVEPNPNELMNMVQGFGLMNYQNMGFSLFSTFKQILLTGSSRLIVLYKQVLHRVYVEFYFYSFIYLM